MGQSALRDSWNDRPNHAIELQQEEGVTHKTTQSLDFSGQSVTSPVVWWADRNARQPVRQRKVPPNCLRFHSQLFGSGNSLEHGLPGYMLACHERMGKMSEVENTLHQLRMSYRSAGASRRAC